MSTYDSVRAAAYYLKNKHRIKLRNVLSSSRPNKAKQLAWRVANRERLREAARAYQRANRLAISARRRARVLAS